MVSDPTLPAIVGYFAGLLYNQNNVVSEAAPETVRKERAFIAALARMIGFPDVIPEIIRAGALNERTPFSWGHLCSGGTVANLEALWVARNVRLYAPAIRLLAATEPRFDYLAEINVHTPADGDVRLGDLDTRRVMNLSPAASTDLHLTVRRLLTLAGPDEIDAFEHAVPTVRKAGLAGMIEGYNAAFPSDPARAPVVLVSQAAHYGWGKALDIVGLGMRSMRLLRVDDRIRLDAESLAAASRGCARDGEPVLMAISIAGTTEEGAVDPVHEVERVKVDLASQGISFWHHCDAAFGGYLATMLPRDAAGRPRPYEAGDPDVEALTSDTIEPEVYRALHAMGATDSITIDPHKLGYVPYPAGAVLFRDYHVRDALSFSAPYLPDEDGAGFAGFLGRWTLEGSRPGAPAVSAYLSQAVTPLDAGGHGAFVRDCIVALRTVVDSLRRRFPPGGPAAFVPFAEPDSVGLCFAVVPASGAGSIAALNDFTRRLWRHLETEGRDELGRHPFLFSRTEVDVAAYRPQLTRMLGEERMRDTDAGSLLLLRVFAINPFLRDWCDRTPAFQDLLCDHVESAVVGTIKP
jgi:glutamate/tyrosine decarboxylase-like PLP-dependent enzyme